MNMQPVTFSSGVKSISDDDLCATCRHCDYQPGDLSGCYQGWPGLEDQNQYVQQCSRYEQQVRTLEPA